MSTESPKNIHDAQIHGEHHAAPIQLYSDEAADKALILALGIMASAAFIIVLAVALSAFFLKTTDGIVHGITAALIICVASTILPMSITIHIFNKKNSSGH